MEGLAKRPPRSLVVLCLGLAALFFAFACGDGSGFPRFGLKSEVVVANANFPTALAFAPDGRLFFTEQYFGNIRVVSADGQLLEQPFATVDRPFAPIELGLVGLALDPEFESNGYVYVFYTRQTGDETSLPVLIRYTDRNSRGVNPTVISAVFPATVPKAFFNAAGAIHFGPDGYLYVSLGDYDQGQVAQDLAVANGKILRVNKVDGSAPADNPFVDEEGADPRIFAYGLRKVVDFAFHPDTGELYAPDANSDTCDELNIVRAGQNYGWPMSYEFRFYSCTEGQPAKGIHFFAHEGLEPVTHLSVVNPTGVAFVSAGAYPSLGDGLLICERASHLMRRLVLEGSAQDRVTNDDAVVNDCALDIALAPDGTIYYSNDTEIRRLVK